MISSLLRRLLLPILLTAASVPAYAGCDTHALATVPLQVSTGTITVEAAVDGKPVRLVLDTGAQRSMLTEAAAQRLGVPRDTWVGTTMSGIGGIESRPNADPTSLSLGGVPLVRRTLNHDRSLTVGVLPRASVGGAMIDGLLGRDFLSVFDLDLDVPNRRLTLYRVTGCAGHFLPWPTRYDSVPVHQAADKAIVLGIIVDGVQLRAMLDTGADSSLIAAPGIIRLGLTPSLLAHDPGVSVSGLGRRSVAMRRHSFRTMQIGQTTITAPTLWVAPVRLVPIVDMLLGADWVAGRRLWISYATAQLFTAEPWSRTTWRR